MSRVSLFLRPFLGASALAAILTLLGAAVALAGGGDPPYPR
jgi:hypothetical protein